MSLDATATLLDTERLMGAGRLHDAKQMCRALVVQDEGNALAWRLLGQINGNLTLYDDAAACFRRAMEIAPHDTASHFFLGMSLLGAKRMSEAVIAFQRATELDPRHAAAQARLGEALHQESRFAEAQERYEAALVLDPNNALLHCNLGLALVRLNLFARAAEHLRRAAQLNARNAEIQLNLGETLIELGQFNDAETALRRAISLDPGSANAHRALGSVLALAGRYSDAIESYRMAIHLQPDFVEAMGAMATTILTLGFVDEAVAMYRRAHEMDTRQSLVHGSLLLPLHYLPSTDPKQLFGEHLDWAAQHVRVEAASEPRGSGMSDGRLRIGYFSPDLRMHSVAYFLEPLVSHHDSRRLEIVMYSAVKNPDSLTERFQSHAALWRDMSRTPDDQFRDTIRNDNLDIFVDLAGHTEGSRLKVIGERLAPVQISYLGYPGSTGLRTMDYRLTDDWADPKGSDVWYTEKLVRLPGGFLCYSPIFSAPSEGPLPALRNDFVTFGSFNSVAKLSAPAVALWARILRAIPRSRLFLKSKALADPAGRQRVENMFARHGVSSGQLVLKGWASSSGEHLAHYRSVDIALDTFPYNGTTTTCEALWMGVPVVTLAGSMHAGRVGVSLLSNAGLSDLIAKTADEYVEIAAGLSNDRGSLATLRSNLRSRMQKSPLCDAKRIAREVENAYQSIYTQYRGSLGAL